MVHKVYTSGSCINSNNFFLQNFRQKLAKALFSTTAKFSPVRHARVNKYVNIEIYNMIKEI